MFEDGDRFCLGHQGEKDGFGKAVSRRGDGGVADEVADLKDLMKR